MTFKVDKAYGNTSNIDVKLKDLLNGASITTLHCARITRVYGSDRLLAYIVYE